MNYQSFFGEDTMKVVRIIPCKLRDIDKASIR